MADNIVVDRVDEFGDAPTVGGVNAGEATQAQAPNPEAKPVFTSDAPETNISLHDLLSEYELTSSLSEKGRQFLATIEEAMADKSRVGKYNWNVEVIALGQPRDSRVIIANNKAIGLIMAETNGTNENFPTTHHEKKAFDELGRIRPGVELLSFIVITPEDYDRAGAFAAYIRNIFIVAFRGHAVTLNNIRKDTNFTFSDNVAEYEQAYRELNPHAVPLRHDLCLTIYESSNDQRRYNYNSAAEADIYWQGGAANAERRAFATIGGYVEFIRTDLYNWKYYPVVHISEISSRMPDEALIPLFLVIAMKRFIVAKNWLTPYRQMQTDVHGNTINLGALFPDGNGGRWVITKPEDFEKTVASSFTDAQLVLDVTEGRASIPGLVKYALGDVNIINGILQLYANTIGANIPVTPLPPFQVECPFYRGYYSYGNMKLDSANIDFLNEYAKHPTKISECEKLLIQRAVPEERAKDERNFEGDLKLFYRTDVVRISPQLMSTLDSHMPVLNFLGLTQMNGIYNTNGYGAGAQAWGQYQANNSAGIYNGFYPGAQIYHW